jgi:hypothetical protein
METMWICNWFKRVLQARAKLDQQKKKTCDSDVLIADRSPYSAVFYSQNGHLLEPVIREHIKELKKVGIEVITISVDVARDVLWSRIQKRLRKEPWREKYHEGEMSWMIKSKAFYDGFRWDCVISNNLDSTDLTKAAFKAICDLSKSGKVRLSEEQFARYRQYALSPNSPNSCTAVDTFTAPPKSLPQPSLDDSSVRKKLVLDEKVLPKTDTPQEKTVM